MSEQLCTVLCTYTQRLDPEHSGVRLCLRAPERRMNASFPIRQQNLLHSRWSGLDDSE